MYDKKLADAILEKLGEAFPRKMQLGGLREALPGFAHLPEDDWVWAAEALVKMGLADGKSWSGSSFCGWIAWRGDPLSSTGCPIPVE